MNVTIEMGRESSLRVVPIAGPRGRPGDKGDKGDTGGITPALEQLHQETQASAQVATSKALEANSSSTVAALSAGSAATHEVNAGNYAADALSSKEESLGYRNEAETFRNEAQAATWAGTSLGTQDLNNVVAPGVFFQLSSGMATAERNYPVRAGGSMVIKRNSPTTVVQEYVGYTGTAAAPGRTVFIRILSGGVWSPWRSLATQRVDQTAGRALYVWDDLNNREQLVYGDTGWRDVSSSLINGWTGTILMRRVGSSVSARMQLDSTAATSTTVNVGPGSGFRPTGNNITFPMRPATGNTVAWGQVTGASAAILASNTTALTASSMEFSWLTNDTWPTSLPGTASGGITNA